MFLKHEAVCQSFTQNSNLLNVQYRACEARLSLAPGYFSDLICYSHHSPCHTGFCLFFCSSDVPSTLQTQDLCIFKSLCWNVLLSVATWFAVSHFKSLLKCHLVKHRYCHHSKLPWPSFLKHHHFPPPVPPFPLVLKTCHIVCLSLYSWSISLTKM